MKKDISVVLPCIRPQFLDIWYDAATKACQNYSWEVIIPGPFDVFTDIRKMPNVRIVRTYASPTVALQMSIQLCTGNLIYYGVDDQILLPNVLDETIEQFKTANDKHIMCMRYHEDPHVLNYKTMELLTEEIVPPAHDIWFVKMYREYHLPAINQSWRLAPLFAMKLNYFYELGGFDCRWEYTNYPVNDLVFRAQEDGASVSNSTSLISIGAWMPNHIGDHGPVHDAQTGPDTEVFNKLYSDPNGIKGRIKIDYNNWKDYPEVWGRRFSKTPLPATREEYEEQQLPNWKNETGLFIPNAK